MVVLQFNKCSRDSATIDTLSTNIRALNDTVRSYEMKNGDLMFEKCAMELSNKELKATLDLTEQERKDIERKLGDALKNIAVLKGKLSTDTLVMHDTVTIHDGVTDIRFGYEDKWLSINGNTVCKDDECSTTVSSLSIDMPLKVGYSSNNKFFVTTSCPYASFSDITAAELPKSKKPSRWSLSVEMGVGGTLGYGLLVPLNGANSTGVFAGVGVYVGIGAAYRIF